MVSITDYTAVVSAIATLCLAAFILLQFRNMVKVRNIEISMKLFEWAESERLRNAFRWIEEDFQFENYEKHKTKSSTKTRDYPFEVTAFFEQVGFLVHKKFVNFDVIVDRLGSLILSNWKKLEPWILALRKEEDDKSFGEHFQKLYEKTKLYFMRN